jgi:lysozyme family protein
MALKNLVELYEKCAIRPDKRGDVERVVGLLLQFRSQYEKVEALSGVPWFIIACIHSLEGAIRFNTHLHNGDPLTARTKQVPAGRPKVGKPPFSWHESAVDALSDRKKPAVWDLANCLDFLETYNGLGYRKYHPDVNTPYLFSFTSAYTCGKYAADGKWNANLKSSQVGAVAILKTFEERGLIDLPRAGEESLRVRAT